MAQRETRVFRVRATPEFSVYTAINEGLLTLPGTVLDEPSNVTPARLLSRIVGDPYDGTARRKHAPKPDAKRPNQDAAARALAMQATEFIHTLEDPADDADLGRASHCRYAPLTCPAASVELPSAARRTLSLLSLTVQDLLLAIRARLPAFVGDDKELSKRLSLAFDGSAIIALGACSARVSA